MTIGLLTLIALVILIEIWFIATGFRNPSSSLIEALWMTIAVINFLIIFALSVWGLYELYMMPFWRIQV